MKDILFLTPPISMAELHPQFADKKSRLAKFLIGEKGIISDKKPISGQQPPFGLLFLSAVCKKAGFSVDFLDGYFHQREQILEHIEKNPAQMVGISSLTYNWDKVKDLTKEIKNHFPDLITLVGGAHPNAWQEKCLNECPELDLVAYGEAEETITELLEALLNKDKKELNSIKGIIYRENGKIIKNPARPPVQDLDQLPFLDRDLIDLNRYRPTPFFYRRLPHTGIFASRGCPYHCTFCHSDKHFRARSVENILDEIEYTHHQYGVQEFSFYDETFALNKKKAIAVCEEILKRKLDISWTVSARVDEVNELLLEAMHAAGCWRILYGIESGVQKNLDTICKNVQLDKVQAAVKMTAKAGIESYGMFMFGIPGETFPDGLETIRFAKSVGLDYAHFVNITPFPGTKLYEQVKDEPGTKSLSKMTNTEIGYVPSSITEDQLRDLLNSSFRKFYLRPNYILMRFRRVKSWQDFMRFLRGFLSLVLK